MGLKNLPCHNKLKSGQLAGPTHMFKKLNKEVDKYIFLGLFDVTLAHQPSLPLSKWKGSWELYFEYIEQN